jgi:hypothetical protein
MAETRKIDAMHRHLLQNALVVGQDALGLPPLPCTVRERLEHLVMARALITEDYPIHSVRLSMDGYFIFYNRCLTSVPFFRSLVLCADIYRNQE